MYSVKGGWVGQTFALATTSDSGGKKSRIRRSKEERKSMVESFIKRYQSSNGGNFPSLNLTHKEVGGSFYTVREIVREIIQENRILGPAQFSPELEHDDNVAAQYPLGSIAIEHPDLIYSENNLEFVSNHIEMETMELTLKNDEHYINYQSNESFQCNSEDQIDINRKNLDDQGDCKSASTNVVISNHKDRESMEMSFDGNKQSFDVNVTDMGGILEGNQTNEGSDEYDKLQQAGSLVSDALEPNEELALSGAFNSHLPTEELVVETFPLRPASKQIDDMSRMSSETGFLNGTWNDLEAKPVESTCGGPYIDKTDSVVSSTDHLTTKGTNASELSVSGRVLNMESNHIEVNGEVVQFTEDNRIDEAPVVAQSTKINVDISAHHECIDQIASQSVLTANSAELLNHQSNNVPKGTACLEDRSSPSTKTNKAPQYLAVNGNNNPRDNKDVASTSLPIDRINLQSWERAALKRQSNPLLAIFKAFADALVKFWS